MANYKTRNLLTPFGEKLDKNNVLPEYPRPQLERNSYFNLNGVWDYAIVKKSTIAGGNSVDKYDGTIVVPFCPECLLSGVEKVLLNDEVLVYHRTFVLPDDFIGERVSLNFGAVDYFCRVWLNEEDVGWHKGGYIPFSLDVSRAIKAGTNNIYIEVIDPTDFGCQARGKQTLKPGGIWYTPISGIWQTVWMESTPFTYVEKVRITPDIDNATVTFDVSIVENPAKTSFFMCGNIKILDKGVVIAESNIENKQPVVIKLKEGFTLWTPENPYLYDVVITVNKDVVKSYFGMRKFSIGPDKNGYNRLMLNNKPYFHNGLLDQGYWSDSLYTPPSDEAMIYDIQTMKDMGFNMLRKHIKVEPLRWYYHCDRLGMLVWQDIVSGGDSQYSVGTIAIKPFFSLLLLKRSLGMMKDNDKNYKKFRRSSKEGRDEFYSDMYATMDTLMNVVSLALWVPFNEGWGQFDSVKAAEMMRAYDPTRLLDHASGWHDQNGPDLNSFHVYFTKYVFPRYDEQDKRPIVLSEFGGFSHYVDGHTFSDKVFGYRIYKTLEKYGDMYEKLFDKNVIPNIEKGLSATVYTQVSDVECEINGLLTYDRKIIKIPIERMKKINAKVVLPED